MTDRVCTIEGCTRRHTARGWCIMHYKRWWKHGDPLFVGVTTSTRPARDAPDGVTKFVVYGYFLDGACMYVGYTLDLNQRHRTHSRSARWWRPAAELRTLAEADTEVGARHLEREQIAALNPRHNHQQVERVVLDGAVHGLNSTYANGCRCEPCTVARREYMSRANAERRRRGVPDGVEHNANTYQNWQCRCDVCKAAMRERRRALRYGKPGPAGVGHPQTPGTQP